MENINMKVVDAECFGICFICEEVMAEQSSSVINGNTCNECEKELKEMTDTKFESLAVPESFKGNSQEIEKKFINETVQYFLTVNKKFPKKIKLWKDDEGYWHAGRKNGPCSLCPPDEDVKYPSFEVLLEVLRLVEKYSKK